MRFKMSLSATVGLGLMMLVGCTANPPVSTSVAVPRYRGQEVVLLVPKSLNLPSIWEILIQEWSSQSGATARFVEYEADVDGGETDQDTLKRELQQEASGGCLVLLPFNRLCDVQSSLSPLISREGEFDAKDIFKGLRERVLTREQKLVANPIAAPVLNCYFRSDLLRAAKKTAPETWDDYEELVTSLEQWAPGLAAVEPLSANSRVTTFFARSLAYCKHPENYSVWFDLETGKPTLDTPGFERALEVASRTWKRLSADSRSFTPAECRQAVLTGKAAIALAFEPSEAELKARTGDESAPKADRIEGIEIGVCRLPGSRNVYNRNSKKWDSISTKAVHSPALCGFAGLASAVVVGKDQSNDCAAMNLLATLSTNDVFDRAFRSLPKSVCRESQFNFGSAWYGPELAAEEASQYCDAVAQGLRESQVVFELPVPGRDEFRRAASAALEPLLQGDVDHKHALAAMQKSFEEIVERLGADNVRDAQRKGLGLSPLKR